MREKERIIIEESIKLFAKKGFAQTSVQEIANEAGISKGAFYLYFKSKEELMISIFSYYYKRLQENVESIEKENLAPREKFKKQLYFQLDEIEKSKEFIIMLTREQAVPFNPEVEKLVQKMRFETFLFYKKGLTAIYGDSIRTYLWDLILVLQGIFHSYLEMIMFVIVKLDSKRIATFIINRAVDFVESMSKSMEEPLLSDTDLDGILQKFSGQESLTKKELVEEIERVKQNFTDHPDKEYIMVTLEVLQSEIEGDHPRLPVIQGMLTNLTRFKNLDPLKQKMADFFQISQS